MIERLAQSNSAQQRHEKEAQNLKEWQLVEPKHLLTKSCRRQRDSSLAASSCNQKTQNVQELVMIDTMKNLNSRECLHSFMQAMLEWSDQV